MKSIFLILIAFTLVGCSASYIHQRDTKKLGSLALQYPGDFAQLANKLNPCYFGAVKADTIVVTGDPDTLTTTDTVEGPAGNDSIIRITHTIKIPVTKTIHDTVTDNRALTALQAKYKVASDSLLVVKTQFLQTSKEKSRFLWIDIGLFIIIGAYLIWRLYSFFSGGFIKTII